jgi:hypothetical protein
MANSLESMRAQLSTLHKQADKQEKLMNVYVHDYWPDRYPRAVAEYNDLQDKIDSLIKKIKFFPSSC